MRVSATNSHVKESPNDGALKATTSPLKAQIQKKNQQKQKQLE
jgi:hypothetical protein